MRLVIAAALVSLAMGAEAQPVRQTYRDCHHNARGQLVCRPCHVEHGKWRCGQARVVKEQYG